MLLPILALDSLLQSFFFSKLELPNINNPKTAADTNNVRHFIFMICLFDNILLDVSPQVDSVEFPENFFLNDAGRGSELGRCLPLCQSLTKHTVFALLSPGTGARDRRSLFEERENLLFVYIHDVHKSATGILVKFGQTDICE